MSEFSAHWLSLREPLDVAARAADLGAAVAEILHRIEPRRRPLHIVDLGAGAGANLRYVAPLLSGSQNWLLVDRDPVVLSAADVQLRQWAGPSGMQASGTGPTLTLRANQFECHIERAVLDLATDLARVTLPNGGLITASALLDLVSERWLTDLMQRALSAVAMVWFALSYDGRIQCHPKEPEDTEVRELFNVHQVSDKGFGPALGPTAGRVAERIFAEGGYRTRCAASDWHVGAGEHALQFALLDGWYEAARAVAPHRTDALQDWRARRRAHVEGGGSELTVGHLDMIGYPA